MYNSEHKGHHCSTISPRISFSNDFVDAPQAIKQERSTREAPVSSDFEFSVTNYSMMTADELFSKGRLLPYKPCKDGCSKQMQRATTTLREELLAGDEAEELSLRPPKVSTRWKGLLGLRKSHIGSKKIDSNSSTDVIADRAVESRRSGLVNEGSRANMATQEILKEGGSSCRDVDIEM